MKVHIRKGKADDLEHVLDIYRDARLETRGSLSVQTALGVFENMSSNPNNSVYVAEVDGQISGTFELVIMDNLANGGMPSGVVEDVAVRQKLQGQGIGKTLMQFAMEECKRHHCYKMTLSSNALRSDAHKFRAGQPSRLRADLRGPWLREARVQLQNGVVGGGVMLNFKNKTALVTGASSGIGKVFAEKLAVEGANVILVARSKGKLDALAAKLRKTHGVTADVVVADLSDPKAPYRVFSTIRRLKRKVDMLVNNAGFGTYGHFHTISAATDHDQVMVNVAALVRLTHLFIPEMVRRREGSIINVASGAAFQAGPFMAVYGATKAFVLSFSEALWAEYRGQGVRVLTVCPGPTETGFFKVAKNEDAVAGKRRPPEAVVETALKGLERGKSSVIDGWPLRIGIIGERLVSRAFVARSAAKIMRPKGRK